MSVPAIQFHDEAPDVADFRESVMRGLSGDPKMILPKFFYDAHGSKLFDAICELPEYYLTRTEVSILQHCAGQVAELVGPGALLVELGSGASKKVRLLLDALRPAAYMGVDISRDFLLQSTRKLARDYPWLEVHAACADYSEALALPYCPPDLKKLAFFPGSSIGNFEPNKALAFLKSVGQFLQPDGALLIGVDLKKNPRTLHAAYNDTEGLTAAFNRNLLRRMQTELGARLDFDSFSHMAFYNRAKGRVEMHLVSRRAQQISLDGRCFDFDRGESLHTENSYKYTVQEFQDLAVGAGYHANHVWTDPKRLFSVHYLSCRQAKVL
jgi:dimethylhistidine N-methyltransferase